MRLGFLRSVLLEEDQGIGRIGDYLPAVLLGGRLEPGVFPLLGGLMGDIEE